MSDSLTRPSFMEWPTDILDEIWYLVRLDLRAGLKKRLWATVHSDLVSAARWNIATQHSQRLWGEYDRTLLDEEEGEEEYEDVVTTPPAITLFACERWVLHHPYALAEGAAWWPHTTIESQVGEAIPATADANGLPILELVSERHDVLAGLELAWKRVGWSPSWEYAESEEGDDGGDEADDGDDEADEELGLGLEPS